MIQIKIFFVICDFFANYDHVINKVFNLNTDQNMPLRAIPYRENSLT